jgi:hypothetical protein
MKEIKEFQGVKGIKEKKGERKRENISENKVLQEFEAGLRLKNRFKDEGNQVFSTT